jgi:IS605 OrfB family transposase
MTPKLDTKHDVHGQVVDTVACTVKVQIPDTFSGLLWDLHRRSSAAVVEMLAHRDKSSSANYSTIPSVVAKSLITKYQRNTKCKSVSNVVIPICGDKGRQIKMSPSLDGVRVPALFQKYVLPVVWLRPVAKLYDEKRKIEYWAIRSVEVLHRKGKWFAHISYDTPKEQPMFKPAGTIGVDRNSVGAVATLSDPQNGKVLHLGFNPAKTKEVWKGQKANLQSLGKKRLLHKIRNKQSRRTKYENHVVSKQIVDYAASHRRCIIVEKLDGVRKRGSKIRRYSEKSQWSFYQLLQFILYKAALRGVMVLETDCAYTSQECSRCHKLTKPNGKSYRCANCGHNDHRDANAAFTLAQRVEPIGGVAWDSERPRSALLVEPFLGTEAQRCA